MAGQKIEHSIAEQARAIDELAQRGQRFKQFTQDFNREMLASGKTFMSMYAEFLRVTGQAPGGAGAATSPASTFRPPGSPTPAAPQADQAGLAALHSVTAEDVLKSARIRKLNALKHTGGGREEILPGFAQEERAAALSMAAGALAGNIQDVPKDKYSGMLRPRAGSQERIENIRDAAERRRAELRREAEESGDIREASYLTGTQRDRALNLAARGRQTHLQYDLTDAAVALTNQQQFQKDKANIGRQVGALNTLAGPNSDTAKSIATVLERMVGKMDASNITLQQALTEFHKVAADPKTKEGTKEYVAALDELKKALENNTLANKDLQRVRAAASELAPPGGGDGRGGGPSLYERARPWLGGIAGAFGAATAGAAALYGTGVAMDAAIVGAERRAVTAQGAAMQQVNADQLASADMTNSQNLLKYRADMLFGRQFRYIGTRPTRLFGAAQEELRDEINLSREQLLLGIGGAAAGVVGGAGRAVAGGMMAAGGGPLGAGLGAGQIAGGVSSAVSAFAGGVNQAAQNRYLGLEGGMEGGFLGNLWRGKDETARRAALLKQANQAESVQEYFQTVNKLREAESAELSRYVPALNEMQSMVDVQQQGAVLVGRYAVRKNALLDRLYGKPTQAPELRESIRAANQGYNIEAGTAEFDNRQKRAVDRLMVEKREAEEHLESVKANREQFYTNYLPQQGHIARDFERQREQAMSVDEQRARNAHKPGIAGKVARFFDSLGMPAMYPDISKLPPELQAQVIDQEAALAKAQQAVNKLTLGPTRNTADLARSINRISDDLAPSRDVNYERLTNAVRSIESGSGAGDYNVVNKYGMVGAYQIDPKTWNAAALKKYGITVEQMRGNKAAHDVFYGVVCAP